MFCKKHIQEERNVNDLLYNNRKFKEFFANIIFKIF
jgi:hypothetical protein